MLYSLTDYIWLTSYVIGQSKLFNDVCEWEDGWEYYEQNDEEIDDDEEGDMRVLEQMMVKLRPKKQW